MKKIIRRITVVLITAALMAGLSLTAFAEGASTEAGSFTFKKEYESTDGKTFPSETLEFTVTADSANPDDTAITVGDNNTFAVTGLKNEIPVNYPSFTKVGVYRYTIKENEGSSQGVTYGTETEIKVAILVAYNQDHTGLTVEANVEKADPDADKVDTITNKYVLGGNPPGPGGDPADASLSVKKTVEGNLADTQKYFTMKVTLTAAKTVNSDITITGGSDSGNPTTIEKGWTGKKEVEIKLKHDETIQFNKIPVGVTYSVVEDASHIAKDATPTTEELNSENGYLVEYTDDTGTVAEGQTPLAAVKNTKKTTINTGISLDSLPYVMILAAVAVGAIVIFRRRRAED